MPNSLSLITGAHVYPPKCFLHLRSGGCILWEKNLLFVEDTAGYLLCPKDVGII